MSRLSSLLSRASVDDHEITGVSDADLQAELAARAAANKKHPPRPAEENPRSRYAGAGSGDAERREKMAERRRQKVHAVRGKRAQAAAAAEDEAFRRVKEQARRRPSASPGSSSSSSANPGWRARAASELNNLGRDKEIAGYYKLLELPYGAERDKVKSAYRKLMRKYHPDRHTQSPKKQKAATELTMKVTQAYNGLDEYLKNKGS